MITILTYLLMVVEIMVSFMLIGIILLQKTKAQGMGLAFGSGMGESLFGAQVGNVLTKTTVILAIVFLVNTTLLAMLGAGRRTESVTDSVTETVPAMPQPSAMPGMPNAGMPGSGVAPAMMPEGQAVAVPQDLPAEAPQTQPIAAPSVP